MAYDAAFRYDWTRGGLNLLGSTTQQYEDHKFPLSVIGRGGWELPNWVQGYEAYWRNKAATAQESGDASDAETALRCADDAKAFGEHLKGITEQYQVAYIELDRELAIDKVCDIFTQVNSKGIRLDVFDLINAQFEALWDSAVEALRKAIDLLRHPQEFGATSSVYLPYVSILPAFAALQMQATTLPPSRQLDAQRKIRHWYWASVFTNRYSGSVESTAARDFLDLTVWFADDDKEPALLQEFRRGFRDLQLRREVRRNTSVYNGIFNLLVLRGARDWMTGNVPQYGDLDDHHIVPKDWRKNHPDLGNLIDTILNRTPLTADTNRKVIRNRLPNAYLPELIAENGEPTVRATLETHLISPTAFDILLRDPFTPDDFEAFIAERQRTIQAAIEDLLVKERLDLPPQLRELDAQVEEVELGIRRVIADALDGDTSRLPSHVQTRVKERLQPQLGRIPPSTRTITSPWQDSLSISISANCRTRSSANRSGPRSKAALARQGSLLNDSISSLGCATASVTAAQSTRLPGSSARQRSSGSAKS